MAMPSGNPRTTQNSQQTAQTEEQKEDGDGEDHSPFRLHRRTISSQKTYALKSTIKPVKDSGSSKIHDTKYGRPIWREIREAVFTTLNQVGGGPGDYMTQAAINGGNTLKGVIDGYGGLLGYDLALIDTACGPIRERVYEIICANLEPGSLLLQSLRQSD
jgi:hypothetical protein